MCQTWPWKNFGSFQSTLNRMWCLITKYFWCETRYAIINVIPWYIMCIIINVISWYIMFKTRYAIINVISQYMCKTRYTIINVTSWHIMYDTRSNWKLVSSHKVQYHNAIKFSVQCHTPKTSLNTIPLYILHTIYSYFHEVVCETTWALYHYM